MFLSGSLQAAASNTMIFRQSPEHGAHTVYWTSDDFYVLKILSTRNDNLKIFNGNNLRRRLHPATYHWKFLSIKYLSFSIVAWYNYVVHSYTTQSRLFVYIFLLLRECMTLLQQTEIGQCVWYIRLFRGRGHIYIYKTK